MLLPQNNRKKKISTKLIFSLILIPLILIFLVLAFPTFYATYFNYKYPNAAKVWYPPPIELWNRGINHSMEQIYFGLINTVFTKEVSPTSSIPTIKLLLPDNTLDRFNRKIFLYGFGYGIKKPFSKALAKTQNETSFLRATVKMRGVHNDHHQIWKPSLRISYKKRKFPEGYKNHVIIAPRDGIGFQNWLTDSLAQKWDLMTPKEHFVRLFINKKYFGLYTRVWLLDEYLLINTGKLPGPFFRMEYLLDRKYLRYYGTWNKPKSWKIQGVEPKEGLKMIDRVVGVFNSISYESFNLNKSRVQLEKYSEQLNMYIDKESFAKFLSILCYAGETHVDDIHNNAFWMDPVSGKLKPVLIDTGGLSFDLNRHLNRPITKDRGAFIRPWLINPINFSIYIDHLYEFINSIGSIENVKPLILDTWEKIKPDAVADILASKSGCSRRCFVGVDRLEDILIDLIKFIELRTQWIKDQLFSDKLVLKNQLKNKFTVYVEGFSGIVIQRKDGNLFSFNGSKKPRKQYNLLPSMPIIPKGKLRIKIPEAYAFFTIPGKPEDYLFTHRISGDSINFISLERDYKTLRVLRGLNSLDFSEPITNPIELGPGTIEFQETKVFNKDQMVTIKAGTKVLLGQISSLIIQGPLKIEGTKAKPVLIRPLNPKKPFGVLAVLGKETSGSQIDYLNIEGGSVDRHYNLDITGMFSVHDNSDIVISNSRFAKNFIGDDMVHIMRSNIKIKNSVFENALADAIDLDLVDGEISDIIVKNSGNDGIDISMGTVRILNSLFEKSSDKCVSAGEGTKTIILNSKFKQCNMGIAVKDRSQVKLTNNLFSENKIAYNTYRKKWRWEKGGEGIIKDTLFVNSINTDIKGDKFSKVSFIKSIPKNIKIEGKLQLSSNFKG
jgi:hypothetical protein